MILFVEGCSFQLIFPSWSPNLIFLKARILFLYLGPLPVVVNDLTDSSLPLSVNDATPLQAIQRFSNPSITYHCRPRPFPTTPTNQALDSTTYEAIPYSTHVNDQTLAATCIPANFEEPKLHPRWMAAILTPRTTLNPLLCSVFSPQEHSTFHKLHSKGYTPKRNSQIILLILGRYHNLEANRSPKLTNPPNLLLRSSPNSHHYKYQQ